MHLISTLCAGVMGAANGHAELYIRDTSTRATWYGDFEGTTSNSSGANITLDAYGSVELYVNQLVDVVVKDADGVLVRAFTDGYASPNIEVISPAFTGNDYVSGAAAVNEPTTLQAVLNLWETNAGAPDWKVSFNGATVTIENALGATAGLVYNVKSPLYGAVGDGVTNDQTAIAAALAAAVAAGGGTVFFPKGTYLITTAIEWDHRVSILGVGAGLSVITTNSGANARILTWTVGTAQAAPQSITGMAFAASQTNTGTQLYCTAAVNLSIDGCLFGASSNVQGNLLVVNGGGSVLVTRTSFVTGGAGIAVSGAADFTLSACKFTTSNASFDNSFVELTAGDHSVTGCIFDASVVTVAPVNLVAIKTNVADAYLTVQGCHFISTFQPFTYGIEMAGGSSARVFAQGNNFLNVDVRYARTSVLGYLNYLEMQPVDRTESNSNNPVVPDGVAFWEFYSTGPDPTVTVPQIYHAGQTLDLLIWNNSGGNWTATGVLWAGSFTNMLTTSTTMNNGIAKWFKLVALDVAVAGTYTWHIMDKTA